MKLYAITLAGLAVALLIGGVALIVAAPATPPAGAGIGGCFGNALVAAACAWVLWRLG